MKSDSQPLVSVVIPCYNHEKFVQDSIQSVIDQTYENIELIIIDDGSKDNSVEKIQEMITACQARFVRFEFRHRPNKGLSATLNEALEWCEGEYYSAIASDDMMLPEKTSIQMKYLQENKKVVAIMGGVNLIDDDGCILRSVIFPYKRYKFEQILLSKQKLFVCTQMARLKYIREVGNYKENCPIEDWYMWLKLAKLGPIVNLDKIFCYYRQHDDNTTKKTDIIYSGMLEILNDYKYHPLYFQAVKQIVWVRVAGVVLKNKREGKKHFLNILKSDPTVVFNKNFYRCLRNFLK